MKLFIVHSRASYSHCFKLHLNMNIWMFPVLPKNEEILPFFLLACVCLSSVYDVCEVNTDCVFF